MKYQRETVESFFRDADELLRKNHEESGHFKELEFEPDRKMYEAIEGVGMLYVVSARNEANEIQGYGVYFICPHKHHAGVLMAQQDTLYITPKNRWLCFEFIKYCDSELKKMGVEYVFRDVTPFRDYSPLLRRMKYKYVESKYCKNLNAAHELK